MPLELRGLWQYIELLPTEKERTTASGIHLPQQWWSRQDSTALILQSGPGLDLDGHGTLPPMCQPGDLVLMEYGDFHPVEPARDGHGERGFIWDPRIIGWLDCHAEDVGADRPVPLGDWCLIELTDRPTMAGNVHLTEQTARPMSGRIVSVGPGRLITRGDDCGWRLSVEEICGRDVFRWTVHWGKEADVICVGRYALQWVLIRAHDLIAAEWVEPAVTVGNVRLTPFDMSVRGTR